MMLMATIAMRLRVTGDIVSPFLYVRKEYVNKLIVLLVGLYRIQVEITSDKVLPCISAPQEGGFFFRFFFYFFLKLDKV